MSAEMEAFIDRALGSEQGSAAWLYERVGHITASRFKDVMARLKNGKPSEKRQTYLMEVVIERITGQPQDHFTSAAMQWGTDQEQPSRMAYEAATGAMVEEVGFIKHPTLPMVGGSPDGLIGAEGGWESKSPFNSAVHLLTMLNGMPEEHLFQIQGLLWITGRKWWDFQSFDPRLPDGLRRYVQRVERDDRVIATLETEVIAFEAEASVMLKRLQDVTGWVAKGSPQPGERQGSSALRSTEASPAAGDQDEAIDEAQLADLRALLEEIKDGEARFKRQAKVERISLLKRSEFPRAVKWCEQARRA